MTLTFDLPKQNLEMKYLPIKEKNSAKLFWNSSINIEIMVWTGGHTHEHMHEHTYTKVPLWQVCLTYCKWCLQAEEFPWNEGAVVMNVSCLLQAD